MATISSVSKYDIDTWLESIARGYTPGGKYIGDRITWVEDGKTVPITVSGGQTFGSGGYSAGSAYAGNQPEFVEPAEGRTTSFISDSAAVFRLTAPSVVNTYGGDHIGRDGRSWFHLYVCATEAQREEAKAEVARRRTAEAKTGDLVMLQSKLEEWFEVNLRHQAKHGPGGVCYSGCPDERDWLRVIRESLNGEQINEAGIARFEQPVRAAIRKAAQAATPQERLAVYDAARKAVETKLESEKKAAGREFAHQQVDRLMEAGLRKDVAWKLLRSAGPGRAVDALTWATTWVNAVCPQLSAWPASCYGMMVFLKGVRAEAKGQRDIHEALNGLGLESPAVKAAHLWAIIEGAIQVLEVGLPESFFSGTGQLERGDLLEMPKVTVEALLYRQR